MDLRKLRHMAVLADEKNFSQAARLVHLTQPALSRSIQSLENDLGVRLFERGKDGVELTNIGKVILGRARKLLVDLNSLNQDVRLFARGEAGDLAFGTGPFMATSHLPEILAQLISERPHVRVDVEINNWQYLLERLLEDRIEFFVADIRAIQPDERITISSLGCQPAGFMVRAGHPLAQRTSIERAAEILEYPLIAIRMRGVTRDWMCEFFELSGVDHVKCAVVSDSPRLLEAICLDSDAVMYCAFSSFQERISAGEIVPLENIMPIKSFFSELGIVSLSGRTLSPISEWLIERMRSKMHSEAAS